MRVVIRNFLYLYVILTPIFFIIVILFVFHKSKSLSRKLNSDRNVLTKVEKNNITEDFKEKKIVNNSKEIKDVYQGNIISNYSLSNLEPYHGLVSENSFFSYIFNKKYFPTLLFYDESGQMTSDIINVGYLYFKINYYLIRDEFVYEIQSKIKKNLQSLKKIGIDSVNVTGNVVTFNFKNTIINKLDKKKRISIENSNGYRDVLSKIMNFQRLDSVHHIRVKQKDVSIMHTFGIFIRTSNFADGMMKLWYENTYTLNIVYKGNPSGFIKEFKNFYNVNKNLQGEIEEISESNSWLEYSLKFEIIDDARWFDGELISSDDISKSIINVKKGKNLYWSSSYLNKIVALESKKRSISIQFYGDNKNFLRFLTLPVYQWSDGDKKRQVKKGMNYKIYQKSQKGVVFDIKQFSKSKKKQLFRLSMLNKKYNRDKYFKLQSGKVDAVQLQKNEADIYKDNKDFRTTAIDYPWYYGIIFNKKSSLYKNTEAMKTFYDSIFKEKIFNSYLSDKKKYRGRLILYNNKSRFSLSKSYFKNLEISNNLKVNKKEPSFYNKIRIAFQPNIDSKFFIEHFEKLNTQNNIRLEYTDNRNEWDVRIIKMPFITAEDAFNLLLFPDKYGSFIEISSEVFNSRAKKIDLFINNLSQNDWEESCFEIEKYLSQEFDLLPLYRPSTLYMYKKNNIKAKQTLDKFINLIKISKVNF